MAGRLAGLGGDRRARLGDQLFFRSRPGTREDDRDLAAPGLRPGGSSTSTMAATKPALASGGITHCRLRCGLRMFFSGSARSYCLMLKNRIYRGEIVHKGKASPGEHAAIVDEEIWRRVQGHLEENRRERREGDKALEPSLLTGMVFDASSEPMTPTHAVKKGTRYRYYVSRRLITGPATDRSRGERVPASISTLLSSDACGRFSPIPSKS